MLCQQIAEQILLCYARLCPPRLNYDNMLLCNWVLLDTVTQQDMRKAMAWSQQMVVLWPIAATAKLVRCMDGQGDSMM